MKRQYHYELERKARQAPAKARHRDIRSPGAVGRFCHKQANSGPEQRCHLVGRLVATVGDEGYPLPLISGAPLVPIPTGVSRLRSSRLLHR